LGRWAYTFFKKVGREEEERDLSLWIWDPNQDESLQRAEVPGMISIEPSASLFINLDVKSERRIRKRGGWKKEQTWFIVNN